MFLLLCRLSVDEDDLLLRSESFASVSLCQGDAPVDQGPYAASADSDQLYYAKSDLSSDKSVNAEFTEEEAEKSYKQVLINSFFHDP